MILMTMLLGVASVWARPALKGTIRVEQPDGSSLNLRLLGDEFLHWNTTADGYSVVKNQQGYYVYARLEQGQLVPTALTAHDAEQRSAQELDFLKQTGRVKPQPSSEAAQLVRQTQQSRAEALRANYDYAHFKGLVLLVEYNDCPFTYSNYHDIMEGMINEDEYTGNSYTNFNNPWGGGGYIQCTGSMRDYFRDNSNGIFVPTFDIIGPVKINRSQYYSGQNTQSDPNGKTRRSVQLMVDACTAADSLVNFKDYDVNNDGKVDMIYFIFSGLPSYIQGNDSRLLWPHQYDISYSQNVRKDGVQLGRYACSTELYGYQSYNWSILEGIGTMCHEFSHVLGLPDFYDTDNMYDEACINPSEWSVMAAGADFDYVRRPCGYSLYERYALGFATPDVISEPGNYQLEYIAQSNQGFRINTPVKNEYFLLENRQLNKWDAKLPGHGMLVFRVDSTNAYMWTGNSVNDNPDHPYYELIRAKGEKWSQGYIVDSGTDPFPGTGKVTELDNETEPANLKTWAGKDAYFGLSDISEQDGIISFNAFDAYVLSSITLREEIAVGVGTSLQLTPQRKPLAAPCTLVWTSDNEDVATVSQDGMVTGIGEGTAHVTVTANDELSATCLVTVSRCDLADNVAAMCALEEGSEALLVLKDAQVLYVYDKNVYLRDASGAIVLNDMGLGLKNSNKVEGSVYGRLTLSNGMPVLTAVEGKTTPNGINIEDGEEPEPISLHISQLTPDRYSEKVFVTKVQLISDGGIFAVLGDKRVRLYNTLKVSGVKVPTDLTKRYDVTAIFGTNTMGDEVIDELYLLKTPVKANYTALTGIALPEAITLAEGRTYQLEATLTPATADVFLQWTSSNEQVVTVSPEGLLTAGENGVAIITVTNLDNGLTASCAITVGERIIAKDIADFKGLKEGTEAELMLNDAQVTFVNKKDAYVRDASGAICFSSTNLELKAGDMLNGHVYGVSTTSEMVPWLKPIEGFTTADGYEVGKAEDAVPRELKVSELSQADLADYIVIRNALLGSVEGLAGAYAIDGDSYVRIYNNFGLKITIPKDYAGKFFDVTGILLTANVGKEQVLNLALTENPVEVEIIIDGVQNIATEADETVTVYTANGQLLLTTTGAELQRLPLKRGIYVVKSASKVSKIVMP